MRVDALRVELSDRVLMLPRPPGADDIEALSQRYFAGNAIIANTDWAAANPELMTGFLRAVAMARTAKEVS